MTKEKVVGEKVWENIVKKNFRFVNEIGVDEKDCLEKFINTIDCGFIRDCPECHLTNLGTKNLREYFPNVNKYMGRLIKNAFNDGKLNEINPKEFIMCLATEILNYEVVSKRSVQKKVDDLCVPGYAIYIGLAAYAKETMFSYGWIDIEKDKVISKISKRKIKRFINGL